MDKDQKNIDETMTRTQGVAVALADSATPPERFLLVKFGRNDLTKGADRGFFDFNEGDAQSIIMDFSARGKDIVIDYEHQTNTGNEAPAAGWIRRLAVEPGQGLFADGVEWTEKGRARLEKREYRYHSPVLYLRDGRPFMLQSVALTNHPALHGYPALVADDNINTTEEQHMNENLKKIATMSGVNIVTLADGKEDEKATAEAVFIALADQAKKAAALAELLVLHDCKTAEELALRIAGMVPAAEKQALEGKLAKIAAEKAVSQALTDGKLVEAQKTWALAYAEKDLQAFSDFVAKAPKVAPGIAPIDTGKPAKASDRKEFSDVELTIFKRVGLSNEQIKKNLED